jgi:hypothetical protein
LVAELEHAAEILFDEGAEEGCEAKGEGVFDFVAEEGGVGAVGDEAVGVAPGGERALFLDVGEEAIVLVFGVDGDPGFIKGPEEEAEFDAGARLQAAGAGDDFHLLPRGEEEGKDVVAFVEGEEFFDRDGEAGLIDEVGHCSIRFQQAGRWLINFK